MAPTRQCYECGAPLDPAEPGSRCAACLLKLAFEPEPAVQVAPPVDPAAQPGERIGPYRLLEVLGEGGMGIAISPSKKGPFDAE